MVGYTGVGMMGAGGVLGGVLMLAFWVFVVAGIVWLVLALGPHVQGRNEQGGSALAILSDRLARGDIDPEEYRTRRAAIEGLGR